MAGGMAAAGGDALSAARSLRRGFALTLLGNFAYGAAQWGMLVVLAKFGSPELVGRFTLALALTAPVLMFAGLRLRAVVSTDAVGRYELGDYTGLLVLSLSAAMLVVAGLAGAGARSGGAELVLTVLILGLAKSVEQVGEFFAGVMQNHERMDLLARSQTFKGILSLAAFAGTMTATGSLVWACAALAAAWTFGLYAVDLRAVVERLSVPAASLAPRFSREKLLSLARLALPLAFSVMLTSLFVNVPRYFIDALLGEREQGIFAAMAYVGVIGMRVVNSLAQVVIPRLAKQHAAGDMRGFARLLALSSGVGVALGAFGVAVAAAGGRPLLSALYSPEFAQRLDVFLWLMAAAGLGYLDSFLEIGVMSARQFWSHPYITAAGALVLAAGCAALAPSRGLLGVAMAMTLAQAVNIALRGLVLARVFAAAAEARR